MALKCEKQIFLNFGLLDDAEEEQKINEGNGGAADINLERDEKKRRII